MNNISFKVFTRCFTYNQVGYIGDALDGFCMQQTNFPFVCLIMDDASTDGEVGYLKNYLDNNFEPQDSKYYYNDETDDYRRVFTRHKTNRNCYFVVIFLKYNHYQIKKFKTQYYPDYCINAEYQALCEGDDYWTDPLKLQKQVDYLDSHQTHSMCFHASCFRDSNGNEANNGLYDSNVEDCDIRDYIVNGFGAIRLNTILYRTSMYIDFREWAIGSPIGDGPICLTLFEKGKVAYMNEVMSLTRVNAAGSWHLSQQSSFKRRRIHYKKVLKLWRQFDKWSKKKHHKVVREKIKLNRKNYCFYEVTLFLSQIKHSIFN